MKIITRRIVPLVIALVSCTIYSKYDYKSPIVRHKFDKFFKDKDLDPDYLAPKPILNKFDKGILRICGDWGSTPTKQDLQKFLDDPDHKDDMDDIYTQLNKEIKTPNATLEKFKEEFVELWFQNRGFIHIFCGEPDGYKQWTGLGGMHFAGRYLEAQEKGWAGAIWDNKICDKNEIKNPVYTIGIRYKNTKGEVREKCPGGFDYLSAKDIFIKATKAWKDFERSGNKKEGQCLYRTLDEYQSVLQVDNYAILSFFSTLSAKYNTCGDVPLEKIKIEKLPKQVAR
ncbi:MAG: hypothetical protein sL5_05050 [Candidatus Mesenet longicola]|uniref:Bacterial EndoU nuclease domain-containing protein n=1 Tax=Candidatus Mesenet longicola TaxID=1892558 RepID=A0A8J3HUJ7_9RICK|nr:MAG: hypothetical protein sGL2_05020 [Candidatus Mesenet longicola]GHM59512.1 MAG: hypothetical protein sL5_05050 [Candidatus Mesenet longicola]